MQKIEIINGVQNTLNNYSFTGSYAFLQKTNSITIAHLSLTFQTVAIYDLLL